ncbi:MULTISPECIES: lipoate--protein ligase [unclassified Kaistella]|uniref:lipoate--protein ligase n=1 Tax=unclassified Kaistella TaxID=2762626 RepID=UPI002734ACFA|nr:MULTISPECIES: lipoate--protein ligase [unclassified Kaistella]MDP2453807.1 lipoate--protein ligase [Kaistella sp. SH11-4b]MDP2456864.1 lipoate--protein ligase [Kaistella sp. SH40-3]MDP2459620.1 lipoate--protein ligase [Kaistella sp. SH19-2b]
MLLIDSPSHNAYFNIASEEYLLHKFPTEDIFLLYVNAPSIIVGKFQNTLAEINLDYVTEKEIKVVRRMSGGGTVYHDLGNLNFSFHTLLGQNDFGDFSFFTQPVLNVLNQLGVPAVLQGRNDLLVDGKKFSGNAKLARHGKMIQHGTILLDSEMEVLGEALKVNPLKFIDKAIKSTRSRVTNLINYLPKETTTADLKQLLTEEIMKNNPDAKRYELTEEDLQGIQQLMTEKYETWDWNFGFSPNYNFKKAIKIPAGFIEVHLDVEHGMIQKAKIFGDFFASKPIEELEELLIGKKHEITNLKELFSTIDLTEFFGKVTLEEVLEGFK